MWRIRLISITPQIAGVAPSDKIVTAGISAPASLPALFGVPYHHSNASCWYMAWILSVATTPEIRANRVNGGNAALTLPLPRLAMNKIGNRVGIENDFNPLHGCILVRCRRMRKSVSWFPLFRRQPRKKALNMYFGGSNMQLAGARINSIIQLG